MQEAEFIEKLFLPLIQFFPSGHKAVLQNLKDNDAKWGVVGHNQLQWMELGVSVLLQGQQ